MKIKIILFALIICPFVFNVSAQNIYSFQTTDVLEKMKDESVKLQDFTKASEIKTELNSRNEEVKKIGELQIELETKVNAQDYENAATIKAQIKYLQENYTRKEDLRKNIALSSNSGNFEQAASAKKELELLVKNKNQTSSIVDKTAKKSTSIESTSKRIAVVADNVAYITDEGNLWIWGGNDKGQIGNGSPMVSSPPVQVKGMTECIAVHIGIPTFNSLAHFLVLKKDGTVWSLGNNKSGQLGDGTNIFRTGPVQVVGLTGIIAISAKANFCLALKNDGTVWSWGNNKFGQLGNGSDEDSNIPVKVSHLEDVIIINTLAYSSVAVKKDGTVWSWGSNGMGQFGDDTKKSSKVPVMAKGLSDVISVAGGTAHLLALKKDGTVWSWGDNFWGQLGDGTKERRKIPIQVNNLKEVKEVSAGSVHSFVLMNDGTAMAWGANSQGQLGDSSISWHHAYQESLRNKGSLASLGSLEMLQIGNGINSNIPVNVYGLKDLIGINAGTSNSIAIKSDGSVWIWGSNGMGQFGYVGPPYFSVIPIKIGSGLPTNGFPK